MKTEDFIFIADNKQQAVESGSFSWSSPSNIALVKYWGKKENQIPANASLSFTLKNCKTITTVHFERKEDKAISFDLWFEGQLKEDFKPKVQKFFERILAYCPYIQAYHFKIETENSFPHSSGIASSASGMEALAVNIISLEKLLNPEMTEEFFDKKASFLARLGSGSAARSIKGEVVVWGEHPQIVGSSALYGVTFPQEIHEVFHNFCDVILLVDKGEKKVSSTVGHDLMHNHPYALNRFSQAEDNLSKLKAILVAGDMEGFIALVESEALTLHAMMMTSLPYFILMKPNTLRIIEKIWEYREATAVPLCFTLDAGANVHLLFPQGEKTKVMKFITEELAELCEGGHFISDELGIGSMKIN